MFSRGLSLAILDFLKILRYQISNQRLAWVLWRSLSHIRFICLWLSNNRQTFGFFLGFRQNLNWEVARPIWVRNQNSGLDLMTNFLFSLQIQAGMMG